MRGNVAFRFSFRRGLVNGDWRDRSPFLGFRGIGLRVCGLKDTVIW